MRTQYSTLKLLFVFIVLLFFVERVSAMGLFAKKVMFSEVTGTVTLDGQPVKGAEIIQIYQWAWDEKKEEAQTTTDAQGMFKFPLREKGGIISNVMPHEPVIFQQILIKCQGKEYVAWQHSKHNYELDGELKGKKLALRCELSDQPRNNGVVFGICTY
jgi:hypothetical protein